jgi:hypothetical protein
MEGILYMIVVTILRDYSRKRLRQKKSLLYTALFLIINCLLFFLYFRYHSWPINEDTKQLQFLIHPKYQGRNFTSYFCIQIWASVRLCYIHLLMNPWAFLYEFFFVSQAVLKDLL